MYGTGAKLSSEQEQEKLAAYRRAGMGADLTDSNTLEDSTFQNWSGGGAPQGGGYDGGASAAMGGLAAASPDMPQTPLAAGGPGGGGGTSLSGLDAAAPEFKGFSTASLASGLAEASPGGGGPGTGMTYGPGYRPNLGQRIYGNESSPLAGLRRIY